eukprot:6481389-Pyramimonas_sp.AAC.1
MVQARDNHVRYPPGWPGHEKNIWLQLMTTMLDTPWVACTRKNTWSSPPRGGISNMRSSGAQEGPGMPRGAWRPTSQRIDTTYKLSQCDPT